MKYWKNSKNEYGTMNDDGFVPDSIEVSKTEYESHTLKPSIIILTDMEKLIAWSKTPGVI